MKIAITSKTLSNRPEFVKWLNERFDEVRLNNSSKLRDDSLVKFLDGCECVVLGTEPFHRDVVLKTDLDVVFKYGVGIDNIDFDACREKELPIICKQGTNSDAVSEIAISYMIQLLRNQHISFSSARRGQWDKQSGKELADAKIGVLGYGHVGKKVCEKVKAIAPKADVKFSDINSKYHKHEDFVDVETLFSRSDVITIHIDNGGLGNTNFVDDKLISLMSDETYVINTARGSVLDYESLEKHLWRLGGVALDVYPKEPEIPEFLIESDEVILSCHICGSSETGLKNGENFIKRAITKYLKEKK